MNRKRKDLMRMGKKRYWAQIGKRTMRNWRMKIERRNCSSRIRLSEMNAWRGNLKSVRTWDVFMRTWRARNEKKTRWNYDLNNLRSNKEKLISDKIITTNLEIWMTQRWNLNWTQKNRYDQIWWLNEKADSIFWKYH